MIFLLLFLLFLTVGGSAIDREQCYYQSNVAVAFEMSNGDVGNKIQEFISNRLFFYPKNVYKLGSKDSGMTNLALVPYPNTQMGFIHDLMGYGVSTDVYSIKKVLKTFGNLSAESYDISQSFKVIANLTCTGHRGFVILIGTSDKTVTSALHSAQKLKNLGFGIITIAYNSNADFKPLASRAGYDFLIKSVEDEVKVARKIGEILSHTYCTGSLGKVDDPNTCTCTCDSTTTFTPEMCEKVFDGHIAVVFELLRGSSKENTILQFVEYTLLASKNYALGSDGLTNQRHTLATTLPYPSTNSYNISGYGSVQSITDVKSQVEGFNSNIRTPDDGGITDALLYIHSNLQVQQQTAIIIVGNNGSMISPMSIAVATVLRESLKIFTVSIAENPGDFSKLSSGDGYSFIVSNGNDQYVSNRIAMTLEGQNPGIFCQPILTPTPFLLNCNHFYNGDLAVIFELAGSPASEKLTDFIKNYLYSSPIFDFESGTSEAINVPYPSTYTYINILRYSQATSAKDLANNINILINNSGGGLADPIISDDQFVQNTSLDNIRSVGYKTVSVAIGDADFSPLAENPAWSFKVSGTNQQDVAKQISQILCNLGSSTSIGTVTSETTTIGTTPTDSSSSTTISTGPTDSTTLSSSTSLADSTTTSTLCANKFDGDIAVIFELAGNETSDNLIDFISNYIYNPTVYSFDTDTTEAINVPYPSPDSYNNILRYGQATSVQDLTDNIGTLVNGYGGYTDPLISDGLEYVSAYKPPRKQPAVAIIVGINDEHVHDTSLANIRAVGYKTISVAIGDADFSPLAENPSWSFNVNSYNQQDVANRISQVLCNICDI